MVDLKGILPSKESIEKKPYYWALIIEPGWIQAGIWSVNDEKVELITHSTPVAWGTDEELIAASDTALSNCIQNFSEEEKEPSEVVFGVPGDWVSGGNIKEEFLEKIKNICSELSLKPSGFVVLAEAIAFYVKSEEGSPLTAVTIGIFAESLEITQFQIGKIIGTAAVARSVSIADDVAEGLSRISVGDNFPSRFILYDAKEGDLEDALQALLDAKWENFSKIKFLHTPKVEIISPEKKIIATSLAGGIEIADAKSAIYENLKEESVNQEIPKDVELKHTSEINASDVGFILGEDVTKIEKGQVPVSESGVETVEKQGTELEKTSFIGKFLGNFTGLFSGLSKIKPKVNIGPKHVMPKGYSSGRKYFLTGLTIFILVLVGGAAWWWFVPKAVVKIYVAPQKLEDKATIVVDENTGGTDTSSNTIPGSFISETVESDKTKSSSGTKTVGEKAKGEVTLYRSGNEISLDSGTVIKSSSGLEYTLNGDATVASGSAGTAGTTKVGITASKIGSDYNLASGESFSVSNYPKSDLEAKNDSTFSGGSSREVSVVSDDDQKSLEDDLTGEIINSATEKIQSNLESGKMIVTETAKTEVIKKNFDKKVGDEGGTLKLDLELKVSVLVIDKKDLGKVAIEILKGKVSGGYSLKEDQIKYVFKLIDEKGSKHDLDTTFSVNLLPKVDSTQIQKNIAGKYTSVASDYLINIQGFKKAQIDITPKLPAKLNTLPRISKNISIEIEAY